MRWPALFECVDSTTENWIVEQMYIVSSKAISRMYWQPLINIKKLIALDYLIKLAIE